MRPVMRKLSVSETGRGGEECYVAQPHASCPEDSSAIRPGGTASVPGLTPRRGRLTIRGFGGEAS